MAFCSNCGVPAQGRFCSNCGAPVDNTAVDGEGQPLGDMEQLPPYSLKPDPDMPTAPNVEALVRTPSLPNVAPSSPGPPARAPSLHATASHTASSPLRSRESVHMVSPPQSVYTTDYPPSSSTSVNSAQASPTSVYTPSLPPRPATAEAPKLLRKPRPANSSSASPNPVSSSYTQAVPGHFSRTSPPLTGGYSVYAPAAPPLQTEAHGYNPPHMMSTSLVDAYGQRTEAFNKLAASLFIALDQSFAPRGTRGLEPSKMVEYRIMSGQRIPPYYDSHVLPMYYEAIGAECVAHLPTRNVLTWNGWHTFLHHKVLSQPQETFTNLSTAIHVLRITPPRPLMRADLPWHPDAEARFKEEQFQRDIRQLAQTAMQVRTVQTAAMAGILRQGANNLNMISGNGYSYW